MPIERKGEFLQSEDSDLKPSLGIESNKIDSCIAEAHKRNIVSLFGSPGWGFSQDNLDFLKRLPNIEKISFWEINLNNISGVYSLANLRYFLLDGKRPGVDFEKLPKIETIIWPYNKKDTNLETLPAVRNFYLWHFNPKDKSFDSLNLPKSLRKLEINWANPETLEGFPHLPNLEEVEFHLCRNLSSLEGLEKISPKLKRIVVTRCNSLGDLNALDLLANLKEVFVDHKRLTR